MTSIVTLKIGEPQYSYIPVYNFTYIYILCIYCVYIHRYQYQYPCFPYVLLSNRCTTYTSCGPTRDTQLLGVYVSVFVNCFSCGETHIPIILSYFVQVYMCHVYVILCVCVSIYIPIYHPFSSPGWLFFVPYPHVGGHIPCFGFIFERDPRTSLSRTSWTFATPRVCPPRLFGGFWNNTFYFDTELALILRYLYVADFVAAYIP